MIDRREILDVAGTLGLLPQVSRRTVCSAGFSPASISTSLSQKIEGVCYE